MGERQERIAKQLDDAAQEAADMGYPETSQNLREQATVYRANTGQPQPQPQEGN